MSLLAACEDTLPQPDQTAVSAALLEIVRRNLIGADGATRWGRNAYCGGFGHPQELVTANPFRESWGSFRFVPGATTLTVLTRCTGINPNDVLRCYLNGVLVTSWVLADGFQAYTTAIGALGYTSNQIVEVQFDVFSATKPASGASWGTIEIDDAFISPIAVPGPTPTWPTFGATLDPNQFVQLADGVDWLVRTIGLRAEPLFQSVTRWHGPYQGQTTVRWHGSLESSGAVDTIVANGSVLVPRRAGATEAVRLIVNNVVVASYAVPSTVGEHFYTLTHAIGADPGATRYRVEVDHVRTAGGDSNNNPISRFTLNRVWAEGAAGRYAALNLTPLVARTNYAYSSVKGYLNALSAAGATLQARINGALDIWGRQRLFRRRYAFDDGQNGLFEPSMNATSFGRAGQALLARGRALSARYGAVTFKTEITNDYGLYTIDTTQAQTIVDGGDTVQTELVYLDTLPGMYGGTPYFVAGTDMVGAFEILRV